MDLYLSRDSALHRLDPRIKLFCLAAAFVLAMTFNHPLYVAGIAALILLAAAVSGCLSNLWRLRFLFAMVFVFACVLWPLLLRGPTPIASLGPLTLTLEALLYGLAVGLRLDAMVAAGLIFLSTTRVEEFTGALRHLGLPFPVSFAFSMAFRFVPTFADSAYTIIQAQKSRGLDLDSGGVVTRLRRHVPLLVPVVICAIRNTDLLAMALESRGFGASAKRTEYLELRTRGSDWLAAAAVTALVAAAIWWRVVGHGAVLPRL